MKPSTDRRAILATATAAALVAATGSASAQSTDVRGAVTFAGGAVVPKGQLAIYLDDPAIQDRAGRRLARIRIDSNGDSSTIDFSLSLPTGTTGSQTLQIVARLERADGWLLARGSAPFKEGVPISVTLNPAVY
jgi:uncharacterized lipoprotein YbaY